MAIRLLLRSFFPHSHKLTTFDKFPSVKRFTSHSIDVDSQQIISNPPSQNLVNELSRILSDYRSPQHDIESALTPFVSNLSTNLVEQVLKRCRNLGFSAHRFFLWAQGIPGFIHSKESHHILVDILGSSRQFPFLWDFLVEMKKSESCEISREIFWIVFRAYSRANLPGDAIRAFNKMVDFGIRPCLDDLDQLLYALCKRNHIKQAQEFFDRIKDGDLSPTVKTYSILMKGWGDIGAAGEAQKVFDEMLEKGCEVDLLAWNGVLDALCKGGKVSEAYELFQGMKSKGLKPDAYSYSIFIHASCEANDIHSAFRVLDSMKRYNLVPNVFTYNCIIKKLCKNGKIDEAYELLNEMIETEVKPDNWSYNTILSYHCDQNEVNMALKLISRMDKVSCQPDRHTYNMVLKMLIRIGRFDRMEKVWYSMEKRGFYPAVSTYAVMIHGLCKKRGKLEEACKYFEMMIDEGVPPYNTTCELLRNKLVGQGFAEQADILADKMEKSTCQSIQEVANWMRGTRTLGRSRNEEEFSDQTLPAKSNGYIRVDCYGGLNQMRRDFCDGVGIARLLNATLILPKFEAATYWNESSGFGDVFDVDYFIQQMNGFVHVVKELPAELASKEPVRVDCSKRKGSFDYVEAVLPSLLEHHYISITPAMSQRRDRYPQHAKAALCQACYKALQLTTPLEKKGSNLLEAIPKPFLSLHLRFEPDMVAYSQCEFSTLSPSSIQAIEKARKNPELENRKPWTGEQARLWRNRGKCPLTPNETAFILQSLGIPTNTNIYLAAGDGLLEPQGLTSVYPNVFTKSTFMNSEDFRNMHGNTKAALDYYVSINSDSYMATYFGNMDKMVAAMRAFKGLYKTLFLSRRDFAAFASKGLKGKELMEALWKVHKDDFVNGIGSALNDCFCEFKL